MSTEADIVEMLRTLRNPGPAIKPYKDYLAHVASMIEALQAERNAAADRVLALVDPWTRGAFTGWKGKTGASRITLDQAEEHFSICMADMMHDVRAELSKVDGLAVIATELGGQKP